MAQLKLLTALALGASALCLSAVSSNAADLNPAQKKLLASLPAPFKDGNYDDGKKAFAKCRSCHTLAKGGANMTGPNLYGVFGRKAGTLAGYSYSDAMKGANRTWDAKTLNDYLTDPRKAVPGNKMGFMGVKAEAERTNLIAYLKVETSQ